MSENPLLASFLGHETQVEQLSTEYPLIPELQNVPIVIKKYELKSGEYKSGQNIGKLWVMLSIQYGVDDVRARDAVNQDNPTCYGQAIFLSITNDTIDPHNNQKFAALLNACNIDPTQYGNNEALLEALTGRTLMGNLTHSVIKSKDGTVQTNDKGEPQLRCQVSSFG